MIFTSKRSIRAEVVTYRFDVAFGSLLMQQLHGLDELYNGQGVIRNRTAKRKKMMVSLHFSVSSFSFLRQTKIIKLMNGQWRHLFLGRSDGVNADH
jgi:hypothetical protein